MGKKLSTYYRENSNEFCEIHVDFKEEMFYIKYYDDNSNLMKLMEYPGKSHRYVEDAAENWALLHYELEGIQLGLL